MVEECIEFIEFEAFKAARKKNNLRGEKKMEKKQNKMEDKNNNTGKNNTGMRNAGDYNTGNYNTGDFNTGKKNTGDYNTGFGNSGDFNTGKKNTGRKNAGDFNTGFYNTGDYNGGECNAGVNNIGFANSGASNTGHFNSGYGNTGFFNTDEPNIRMFNKETNMKREDISFPRWFDIQLTEWICYEDMTELEKQQNPGSEITGGYLKTYDYKEAWRKAFDEEDDLDEIRKAEQLPNFDYDIFEEITGISKSDFDKKLGRINTEEEQIFWGDLIDDE